MTQYSIVNVKLSDSQLHELDSMIKIDKGVTLKIQSNKTCTKKLIFQTNCYHQIEKLQIFLKLL